MAFILKATDGTEVDCRSRLLLRKLNYRSRPLLRIKIVNIINNTVIQPVTTEFLF